MKTIHRGLLTIGILLFALLFCFACADDTDDGENDGPGPDDDDDNDDPGDDDDDSTSLLDDLISEMGFLKYLAIAPVSTKDGPNGYTVYEYDPEDVSCFKGDKTYVAVSPGESDNVMLFLEGGGAQWPGGGFCVELGMMEDIGVKSRVPENPVGDWNIVYVPYCDCSLHCGDKQAQYNGKTRNHYGVRHVTAAVALMKELFPDPGKVLVAGSSAGGYGTYYGWLIAKSQYRDTDTYVFNDSGTGFWNPDDLDTFEVLKNAWDLIIPDDCTMCKGTLFTYIYDVYLRYDPQVRIGMFSSYYDAVINGTYLHMDGEDFKSVLMTVTDEIKELHPDRFARFFIETSTHTTYELDAFDLFPGSDYFLAEGPRYSVGGVSVFDWLGRLVNDQPQWDDVLE